MTDTIREIETDMPIVTTETIGDPERRRIILDDVSETDPTTVIGEMTVTAAMTGEEIIDLAAIADIVATGKRTCNCILMAGIYLILSLVVGNVWIQGSERRI